MESIKKWLENEGLSFKDVTLYSESENKRGIMVNTDYDGPYPTKECYEKINKIQVKVRRFKNLRCETRGYKTGVLITKM